MLITRQNFEKFLVSIQSINIIHCDNVYITKRQH